MADSAPVTPITANNGTLLLAAGAGTLVRERLERFARETGCTLRCCVGLQELGLRVKELADGRGTEGVVILLPASLVAAWLHGSRPPAAQARAASGGARIPVIGWGSADHVRPALSLGCEDYLREPWSADELEARLDRVLRWHARRMQFGGGRYLLAGSRVSCADGGRIIELTGGEARILRTLIRNRMQTVPREVLFHALTGHSPRGASRRVDMHVSSLRRKLGWEIIDSVRGQGYRIQ